MSEAVIDKAQIKLQLGSRQVRTSRVSGRYRRHDADRERAPEDHSFS